MRLLIPLVLLLLVPAAPAAAQWERIGAAGPVSSDEERWLVLQEGETFRSYDTKLRTFAPPFTTPAGCSVNALGRGHAIVRCTEGHTHLARDFLLVDLATGAIGKLVRRGTRRSMSVDTFSAVGRRWAGGLSCGSNGQRVCPQVYVNLRTGKRLRIADGRRRDLDSRRLRVTRRAPATEIVRTGPPDFELLLRRPGRPDVFLRSCRDTFECMHFSLAGEIAFWFGDDGVLNAYDGRTDARRTLVAPDGTARPVATATRHALVLTGADGVYVSAR